jgi:hypothetical protein
MKKEKFIFLKESKLLFGKFTCNAVLKIMKWIILLIILSLEFYQKASQRFFAYLEPFYETASIQNYPNTSKSLIPVVWLDGKHVPLKLVNLIIVMAGLVINID